MKSKVKYTIMAALCASITLANAEDVNGLVQLNGVDDSYTNLTGNGTIENGSATTAATLTVDVPSGTDTFLGVMQDGGAATFGFTKTGNGKLILTGTSTYTGDTTISGGTFQLDNGTLGAGTYTGNISIAAGATFSHERSTQEISGVISGDGNLIKSDSGELILSGANTYTGKTELGTEQRFGGTLTVSSFNSVDPDDLDPSLPLASSSLGAPTTVANGTIQVGFAGKSQSMTLKYVGPGETTDRILNFGLNTSGIQTLDASGTGLLEFTSPCTVSEAGGGSVPSADAGIRLRGSGTGELTGGIGDSMTGDLFKLDAGTWSIGGTNNDFDQLKVSAGTFEILSGGQIVARNSVILSGGSSILTVDGSLSSPLTTVSAGTLNGSGTLIFNIDGTSADLVDVNGGTLDISGLAVEVVENGSGLTEAEYILVDATGVGYTGTFTGITGATGYALDYGTADQVKLVSAGGGSPYDTWAGGAVFTEDDNGDGVDNGLAFLLGAADPDADATGLLPTVTESAGDLVLTFNVLNAANRGTATIDVEHSTDLGVSDAWLGATLAVDANDVSFAVTPGDPTDAVIATIDEAAAEGGDELFGRVNASE